MFTGIIETLGKVKAIELNDSCTDFVIESSISHELKTDQSVAHDGACLTVVEVNGNTHRVTAVPETLKKTNLGEWKVGDEINLERCTIAGGRFDGHIVSGHVDQTATCSKVSIEGNNRVYTFKYSPGEHALIVEKGSACINGISLTVFDVCGDEFSVAIIPYTFEHTNIKNFKTGTKVNLEFDIIGKYVAKMMNIKTEHLIQK